MLKLPPRGAGLMVLAKLPSLSVLSKTATSLAPGATPRDQLVPLVKAVLLFALVTLAELLCGSKMLAPSISGNDSLQVFPNDNFVINLRCSLIHLKRTVEPACISCLAAAKARRYFGARHFRSAQVLGMAAQPVSPKVLLPQHNKLFSETSTEVYGDTPR
jgi:hypothetical protein